MFSKKNLLPFQPGDQLMSVNGSSFQNITHTAAVNLLSNSHRNSQLMVTFKRVGRIPYSPDRVPCNGDLSRVTPLADNLQEVNMVTEKVHLSRTILGHHIDWKTFICRATQGQCSHSKHFSSRPSAISVIVVLPR